ncbi:MAG: mammalian cell entry protein, partial [Rhodococcus sp. (in: high G+C Gram-positive bacteria)]
MSRFGGAVRRRDAGNPLTIGLVTVLMVGVLVAVTGYVYLVPPGRGTVEFETYDAVSIAPGIDVRVAGLSVGKVSKLAI